MLDDCVTNQHRKGHAHAQIIADAAHCRGCRRFWADGRQSFPKHVNLGFARHSKAIRSLANRSELQRQVTLLQETASHRARLGTDSDLILPWGLVPCARPGLLLSQRRSPAGPIPTSGTTDLCRTGNWPALPRGGIPLFGKCDELPRECSESRE